MTTRPLAAALLEELRPHLSELVAAEVGRALERERRSASPWMTVDEAADYLRATRQHVYDLRSAGTLTAHREGARALVSRVEVEALVNVGQRAARRGAV
jgi:excisionase family DNA binding protein